MRQAAKHAENLNNFVYEPTSGMYYDPKTGYYYNAVSNLQQRTNNLYDVACSVHCIVKLLEVITYYEPTSMHTNILRVYSRIIIIIRFSVFFFRRNTGFIMTEIQAATIAIIRLKIRTSFTRRHKFR